MYNIKFMDSIKLSIDARKIHVSHIMRQRLQQPS
uniref:Uncharacterized protein n=1 Tax=Lotus japonicus TaxID=34305 RepID=I3S9G2_LOTJA|nr:unknown [Lotus japonicus]